MARFPLQGTFKSGEGKAVEGGTAAITLTGTATVATIYTAASGGSAVLGGTITTSSDGSFLCYIDDTDYATSQYFRLTLSKTGHVTKTYDDIVVLGLAGIVQDTSGNILIGGAGSPTGGGTPVLALPVASGNPTGVPANTAGLFVKDVTASGELFAYDEAGNMTQLSSHDPETGKHIATSFNVFSGKGLVIDIEAMAVAVQKLSGKKIIKRFSIPKEDVQVWDETRPTPGFLRGKLKK